MAGSPTQEDKIAEHCTINPLILNILIKMENKGKSNYTIDSTRKALNKFAKFAKLNNPESVEKYIARIKLKNGEPATDGYKRNLCNAYKTFCDYYKIQWDKPKYITQSEQFHCPTEEKLNLIIAGSHEKLALKLRISKECGLRPIETVTLKAKHINTDNKSISPITAKHGLPRTLPITPNLCTALQAYITQNNIQPDQKIFNITAHSFSQIYRKTRIKVAKNVNDPTINKIRLYDFRHYFGTKTYQKTQNVAITAHALGHNWKNTQIYVDIQAILNSIEEEYTSATAKTVQEACKLIDQGFQHVTDFQGVAIFRKRK